MTVKREWQVSVMKGTTGWKGFPMTINQEWNGNEPYAMLH